MRWRDLLDSLSSPNVRQRAPKMWQSVRVGGAEDAMTMILKIKGQKPKNGGL